MTKCDDVKKLLPLYGDGELTQEEQISVEAHIKICNICNAEFREYREISNQFGKLKEEKIPDDVLNEIWLGIKEVISPEQKATEFLKFGAILRMAAFIIVGIVIGFAINHLFLTNQSQIKPQNTIALSDSFSSPILDIEKLKKSGLTITPADWEPKPPESSENSNHLGISNVEKGSIGEKFGVKKGDIILELTYMPLSNMKSQEGKYNFKTTIKILRNGKVYEYEFPLTTKK